MGTNYIIASDTDVVPSCGGLLQYMHPDITKKKKKKKNNRKRKEKKRKEK